MDGRTMRAQARHAAYKDAADALEFRQLSSEVWARDPKLAQLYLRERARLSAWLRLRADGKLSAPPGGLGT